MPHESEIKELCREALEDGYTRVSTLDGAFDSRRAQLVVINVIFHLCIDNFYIIPHLHQQFYSGANRFRLHASIYTITSKPVQISPFLEEVSRLFMC